MRRLMLLGNQMMALASEIGSDQPRSVGNRASNYDALKDDSPLWLLAAQMLLRERRLRCEYLPQELFGEPAWDMLLDLYVAEKKNQLISTTSACLASNAPLSTALRWLKVLEEDGYIYRISDEQDARRTFVRITEKGYMNVTAYFVATQPQWRLDDVLREKVRRPNGEITDKHETIPRRVSNA